MLFTKYLPAAFVALSLAAASPTPQINLEITLQSDDSYDLSPLAGPTTSELTHQLSLIGGQATEITRISLWFLRDQLPFIPNAIKQEIVKQLGIVTTATEMAEKYAWENHDYFWDVHHEFSDAVLIQAKTIEVIARQLAAVEAADDVRLQLIEVKDALRHMEDLLIDMMPKCENNAHEKCKDQGLSDAGYMVQALGFAINELARSSGSNGVIEL